MFFGEQQFSAIGQQLKKIIYDNCWYIFDNCCSQKKSSCSMLSSIFQRPHVIRWLLPFDDAKLQHSASVFKPVHSRSKTVQNQWNPRMSCSVLFMPIHMPFGRPTKGALVGLPEPLCKAYHRPFERPTIECQEGLS